MSKHIQGSPEWLEMRQSYLGASDAATVLGLSPWSTPLKLWEQKLGLSPPTELNYAMQRGTALEPAALKAFEKEVGLDFFPQVIFHPDIPFMMASLDGLSLDGRVAVEIKCPGAKAHGLARQGIVPDYYMPQLQHQMACLELDWIWYYSFDGETGATIKVPADYEYQETLIDAETKFWKCVKTLTPPDHTDKDYDKKSWDGSRLQEIDAEMALLEEEKKALREVFIREANGRSCKGNGITLRRSFPKGPVQYKLIPELEGVDLELYRNPPKERWTLTLKP